MPGSSPSDAAAGNDTSSAVGRSQIPNELQDKPPTVSSREEDSYVKTNLHADSPGTSGVLQSRWAIRSVVLQRPNDPGRDKAECVSWKGSRLSSGVSEPAGAPPAAMLTAVSAVRDSSSPQSKLHRRPIAYPRPNNAGYTTHAQSTSQTRHFGPPHAPQYGGQPSQPSREEHRSFHLGRRYETSGAREIQAYFNTNGASCDVVALASSVAFLDGETSVSQAFPWTSRWAADEMGNVAGTPTATTQAFHITTDILSGGPVRMR